MPNGSPAPFTWSEWAHEISKKLDSLIVEFKVHKTKMEIKAGLWGALGGAVPITILILVRAL